jgi:hypothetical protein
MRVPVSRGGASMRRAAQWLFAGRLRLMGVVLAVFLLLGTATRIGLAVFNGDLAAFAPQRALGWLLVGLLFDFGVATFVALPFALLAWLTPDSQRGRWFLAPAVIASRL